ncbi:hypothetical protein Glove_124g25 [Diversispora epigaea]|uniref:Autophagy-related protein 13 n=1 Tax=Diversispora epigaea TaxID=1348612 RepID=A0A397IYE7_9GLOM|nr:hypothetical protein Glove_124g25 [Diversispora epigaea]
MYDMHRTPSSSSSQLSASPPSSLPNLPRQSKADQIVQNFYTKVTQIITQARLVEYDIQNNGKTSQNTNLTIRQTAYHSKKPNKWFNLELWDSDVYKDDLKYWRQMAQPYMGTSPLPMNIEFYLDTSELSKNQVLVLTDEILRRRRIDLNNLDGSSSSSNGNNKITKNIMLESWQLTLSHPLPDPLPDLPVVYKKSIAFFRSLHSFVRLLPAYRLHKRIRKMKLNSLKIGYRFVLPSNNNTRRDVGIDIPIIEGESRSTASEFKFSSIDTPLGVLSLKVLYRTNCEFHVDEPETLLSSKFIFDMDENYFTPTMARYYQQEQQQKQEKDERRNSVPTRMDTPPTGFNYLSSSPQFTNSHLIGGTLPTRSLSSPRSNPDLNNDLTFPKIYTPSRSTTYGPGQSNLSAPSLSFKSPDSRRLSNASLEPAISRSSTSRNEREPLFPTLSSMSATRPNVTMVQPFKSPSLSPTPINHETNPPSPTFYDRPLHRSPSQLSLQQRNLYQSPSTRPLSINSGAQTLSSSVRSTSSVGSPSGFPKFSSSFNHQKYERSGGSTTRERDGSFSGRRYSRSSLTNKSDGSTSDRGSYNSSSFFASLDPDDDVAEFVQMINTREPLKMFSRSPTGLDDANNSGQNPSGRTQIQLSRFQKLKETHNNLPESMTSMNLQNNLEPPGGLGLGTSSGSVSSSSTMSSISKSLTHHHPNVPSRLSENVTTERPPESMTRSETMPLPVRIPQTSIGKGNMGGYSAYHLNSPSTLETQNNDDLLYQESNSNSIKHERPAVVDLNIDKTLNGENQHIKKYENYLAGSPASGNSSRADEELIFVIEEKN